MKPLLGITMGDPAGVGPEIVLKAFAGEDIKEILAENRPFVVGDKKVLEDAMDYSGVEVEINTFEDIDELEDARFERGVLNLMDLDNVDTSELKMGEVSAMCGRASVDYIEKTAMLANEEKIHGVVTAPINKQALKAADHPYPGHTETLANLTGLTSDDVTMMLVSGNLRVFHVTIHIPFREIADTLSIEKEMQGIHIANDGLKLLGIDDPKIAVAGLNPHASDEGRFGDEDLQIIKPAVEKAQQEGIDAVGPVPADTVFVGAKEGKYDGVLAQYHDQGHIPAKLMGFMEGVNVTIGLPIIRTSVDHGTAFDIAGEGKADPTNLIAALKVGSQMAKSKFGDQS